MTISAVRKAVAAKGLAFRGAFHPDADETLIGGAFKTVVLVGFVGRAQWPAFAASPEANDGAADPLDRWSQRVIGELAEELGARAIFPFGGPPWAPFLRWAQMAEAVRPSPLGMLIHPDWGLWHSWRGALAFAEQMQLPAPDRRSRPCDDCADKPCLSACPVGAFTFEGYDVAICADHIGAEEGVACIDGGCRARLACPVGAEHRYGPDQTRFHMRAFATAQRR